MFKIKKFGSAIVVLVMTFNAVHAVEENLTQFLRKSTISSSFIHQIGLVCGQVMDVEVLQKSKLPSYKMISDFGTYGKKTSVGQFVKNYKISDIEGRNVWGIINFQPRRIAGVKSEYLTVGFYDQDQNAVMLNNQGCLLQSGTRLSGAEEKEKIDEISYDDFLKAEIIIGKILMIEEEKDQCLIDFGKERGAHYIPLEGYSTYMNQNVVVFANGNDGPRLLGVDHPQGKGRVSLSVDDRGTMLPLGTDLG